MGLERYMVDAELIAKRSPAEIARAHGRWTSMTRLPAVITPQVPIGKADQPLRLPRSRTEDLRGTSRPGRRRGSGRRRERRAAGPPTGGTELSRCGLRHSVRAVA
jgi:hypothetical protein